MSESRFQPVVPDEGLHVLHLYYKIEYGQWELMSAKEQLLARTRFSEWVHSVRALPATQLLIFSVVTPKADIGFMLLTPDLQEANRIEKQLACVLGADVLTPVYSILSMTEPSEYTSTEAEQKQMIEREQGLKPGTPEFETAFEVVQDRMKKYLHDRLYPNMADWPVICVYTMSKRRGEQQNWYRLGFDERKKLMAGHARVGRNWAGKVRQLITGSTGLDDAEWAVTLLAHNSFYIKGIIQEMRFDPVTAEYAEFGDFYIGLQLPLDELFRRVSL